MNICTCLTRSLCWTPETNTTLLINYNKIKFKTSVGDLLSLWCLLHSTHVDKQNHHQWLRTMQLKDPQFSLSHLISVYLSWNFSNNCRGRNTPILILWSHHHPDTKVRQRYHKRRKLQDNVTDEQTSKILNKILGAVSHFILGGSKITADGNCSHEIKRC